MAKIVFSGYFGFNNAGDEAILFAMLRAWRQLKPEAELIVLSRDPEKTAKQYAAWEVKAVNRWRMVEVLKTLASADLLISGGGSLLQDVTSNNSPLYYLGIIFLANLLDVPVMVYAQGVGPLRKKRNRRLSAWLLNKAALITVRDQESAADLKEMGVKGEIIVTADPVLSLKKTDFPPKVGAEILKRYHLEPDQEGKLLGVYLRPWGKNSYLPALAEALGEMHQQGWQIVLIPMQFPGDIAIAREISRLLGNENLILLRENYTVGELLALTGNLDLVIGMRLHALIMAAVMGVPMVGLAYDPKIDRFLRQSGQIPLLSVNNLEAQALVEVLTWVVERKEEIKSEIEKRTAEMYQRAWRTARLALELLENIASEEEER